MTTTALTAKQKAQSTLGPVPVFGIKSTPEEWEQERANRIAEAAYYKAMSRGFEPGHEMEDWLAAEAEQTQ